jgi:hypothetical protein
MPDWIPALERRGISVVRDVSRDEAAAVLEEYAGRGGISIAPARANDGYVVPRNRLLGGGR